MPSDWENLSYKVTQNANDLSTISRDLKPIVWGEVRNVVQRVDNQVEKLNTLQSELVATRREIDRYARNDAEEYQDLQKKYQDLRDLTKGYESKLTRQDSKIKELNSEIKELKKRLDPTFPPQSPPSQPRKPNSPNDSKPVEPDPSSEEGIAKSLIAEGRKAFDKRNFDDAEKNFNQAKKRIDKLSLEHQKRFNEHEIEYYLAACAAFDPVLDLTSKATKLVTFVNTPRGSQSLEWYQLAHANHLLAQLYVQLGELKNAEASCNNTASYTSKLPAGDQRRYEQAGLLIRINVLKGEDEVLNNAIARQIPAVWRQWFRDRYSFLQPKGSPKQPSNPLRPQPPEGIVPAPTWLVPRLPFKSQKPAPAPPPPVPEVPDQSARPIGRITRIQWLNRFELRNSRCRFQEAIIDGDLDSVKALIKGLPSWESPPDEALHIAAIFGEVSIAKALIKAGSDVNRACTIARLRKENGQRHSYGITPMHMAIGIHQHGMIRLLKESGGSFKVPKKGALKNSSIAAPRLLISEGWLELIGCRDPKEVARTIDVLESLGWDINAGLNEDGKTLRSYARDMNYGVLGFQRAVMRDLDSRGAR